MITVKTKDYTKDTYEMLAKIFEKGLYTTTHECHGRCAICPLSRACSDVSRALKFIYDRLDHYENK